MVQTKLAIVDDHNLFRKGLVKLIHLGDQANKYSILFEGENGNDLIEKLSSVGVPDIVLMDVDMPDMDGYDAAAWMKKHYPSVKILVVSMFESEHTIIRMLRLGVKGYLSKDIEVEDMHTALEALCDNGFYYSEMVSKAMTNNIQGAGKEDSDSNWLWNNMTEKEREFLEFACTELTYQQIAEKMYLSPKTIDNYREALFAKFKVKNRVGLAMFAVKNGLVKL